MARYSPSIQRLINELASLPGIGGKVAQRSAMYILDMPQEKADSLIDAIRNARQSTCRCSICQNFADSDPCPICSDSTRDTKTVLVVESPRDVSTFERTHEYKGLYHVLHGVFNPLTNKSLEDTTLSKLIERLSQNSDIEEVIIATNQNAEGNAMALYIARLLGPSGIKVTRLAQGLPMGSEIEYADDLTLLSALNGRITLS
ncbi:MAG: recombination protein RecR [Clostridiales bacterium]|nr:recombination protein RecR [Clostridiales bacterium]